MLVYVYTEHFSKGHEALHTYYTIHRHLLTSNNKYIFNDFNMKIINLFSFFKLDIWLKSFEDWNKVLFVTKYLYIHIHSIFKNTPSCASMLCWYIYRAFFKRTHSFTHIFRTWMHLLNSNNQYKFIDSKKV